MADPVVLPDPSKESGEYRSMKDAWTLVTDVLAGATAIRQKAQKYLTKFEGESLQDYDRRRNETPWRPEFDDSIRSLASKPFSKDVSLKDPASQSFKDLAEDIDGRGNSITAFSRDTFYKGIAKGLHAILIDYPALHAEADVPVRPLTIAQEKAVGARPYWLQIEADDILACYTKFVGGKEIIEHIRFKEDFVTRDGFDETIGKRIRVYEPGIWQVWEKLGNEQNYSMVSDGVISRGSSGKKSVPVVLFFTGERLGVLKVKPPMQDLAQMQIELYRAQSKQEEVLTFASSPMLTANGMKAPSDGSGVSVGPKTVLYAPPTNGSPASWEYINPDAANVKEIRSHVRDIIDDMRRLGMQPLTQRTGTSTATGDSIEAAKAHSAVQAWAIALKDVLEQAFVFTAEWINESKPPEVTVYTDFSAIPSAQAPLLSLATARAEGDISRQTYWTGLQRYDILPADFDAAAEETLLKQEVADKAAAAALVAPPLNQRDPATGLPVPRVQPNGSP